MKTQPRLAGLLLASLALSSTAQEGGHPKHWGYAGEVGPEHWAEFESDFGECNSGRNQSPIDLSNFIEAELPKIAFDYKPGGHEVVNNGHAIQVNYNPGSKITVDGTDFALKQFHFHSPSENTVKTKSFPMEAHFVHADAKGNLAVVALMFEEGASNKLLERVWPSVPKVENGKAELSTPVSASDLLHANRDYYRYEGSLTTPPCSEGVRWLVLKRPAKASAEQLAMVQKAIGHPNNRPVQPVGARVILQ
ncbi:carbonic anhydrase [Pseudoxanthomonas sp. UTMC 1351]|uniref:carbonic anhydrase n=1 Tax=Pseudoxanthomonas sp. UTMC 1351 TaxID=2695853 RepID=UPI0034CEEF05